MKACHKIILYENSSLIQFFAKTISSTLGIFGVKKYVSGARISNKYVFVIFLLFKSINLKFLVCPKVFDDFLISKSSETFFRPHTLSFALRSPRCGKKKVQKGPPSSPALPSSQVQLWASCRRRRRLRCAPTPRPIHVPPLMPYLGDALRLRRSPYMGAVRRTIPGASRRYIRSGKRYGKSLAASPAAAEQLSPYPCLDTEVCILFSFEHCGKQRGGGDTK